MKKIIIDKATCIGCLKCAKICPATFDMGPDGFPVVREDFKTLYSEDISDAVSVCPTNSIKLIENNEQTGLLERIQYWATHNDNF